MSGAQLFVLGGRDVGRSFELGVEAVLGRDPGCEVVLADRSISRRHARIAYDGLSWTVEDLGSRNGVRVDGERVERATLGDRTELLLGELPLRFRLPEEDRAEVVVAPPPPASEASATSGGEIELEEEIELEPEPAPAAPVRPAPVRGPGALAPPSRLRADEEPEERPARRRGLLRGDLSQQPLWVRFLLTIVLLCLAGGLAWAAFRIVTGVRSTL